MCCGPEMYVVTRLRQRVERPAPDNAVVPELFLQLCHYCSIHRHNKKVCDVSSRLLFCSPFYAPGAFRVAKGRNTARFSGYRPATDTPSADRYWPQANTRSDMFFINDVRKRVVQNLMYVQNSDMSAVWIDFLGV